MYTFIDIEHVRQNTKVCTVELGQMTLVNIFFKDIRKVLLKMSADDGCSNERCIYTEELCMKTQIIRRSNFSMRLYKVACIK